MPQALQVIGEAVTAVQAGSAGGDSGKHGSNEKVFGTLDKIDGQNWKQWSHQFKVALKRASHEAFWLFEKVESQVLQVIVDDVEFDEEFVDADAHKRATEIYDSSSLI